MGRGQCPGEHLTGACGSPNTRAAVSIGEYAGDLSISLRTDATVINATDSHLFREFLAGLEQLAAETGELIAALTLKHSKKSNDIIAGTKSG